MSKQSWGPSTLSVDRIEADRVILDLGGERIEVPLAFLPPGATEGSLLQLSLADDAAVRSAAEARLDRLRATDTAPEIIDL